jgi:hypothetical protein
MRAARRSVIAYLTDVPLESLSDRNKEYALTSTSRNATLIVDARAVSLNFMDWKHCERNADPFLQAMGCVGCHHQRCRPMRAPLIRSPLHAPTPSLPPSLPPQGLPISKSLGTAPTLWSFLRAVQQPLRVSVQWLTACARQSCGAHRSTSLSQSLEEVLATHAMQNGLATRAVEAILQDGLKIWRQRSTISLSVCFLHLCASLRNQCRSQNGDAQSTLRKKCSS